MKKSLFNFLVAVATSLCVLSFAGSTYIVNLNERAHSSLKLASEAYSKSELKDYFLVDYQGDKIRIKTDKQIDNQILHDIIHVFERVGFTQENNYVMQNDIIYIMSPD